MEGATGPGEMLAFYAPWISRGSLKSDFYFMSRLNSRWKGISDENGNLCTELYGFESERKLGKTLHFRHKSIPFLAHAEKL